MKLEKKDVYVPVSNITECFVVLSNDQDFEQYVEKQTLYTFSEEELTELLKATWNACKDYHGDEKNNWTMPNRSEYINNLLKQD